MKTNGREFPRQIKPQQYFPATPTNPVVSLSNHDWWMRPSFDKLGTREVREVIATQW